MTGQGWLDDEAAAHSPIGKTPAVALVTLSKPFDLTRQLNFSVTDESHFDLGSYYDAEGGWRYAFGYDSSGAIGAFAIGRNYELIFLVENIRLFTTSEMLDDFSDGLFLSLLPAALQYDDTLAGSDGNDGMAGLTGDDELYGNAGNDKLFGAEGDDFLAGGQGNDTIGGGTGLDTILFRSGSDRLDGSAGIDTLIFDGTLRGVQVRLDVSSSQQVGSSGRVQLSSIESIEGTYGRDRFIGSADVNSLSGAGGDDWINGNAGADTVSGGYGRDTLFGGAGNDILSGDGGNDTLLGGSGIDRFDFFIDSGADIIEDFQDRQDKIRIVTGDKFSDLKITDRGDDVMIAHDGGSIWVKNIQPGSLTAADFVFV